MRVLKGGNLTHKEQLFIFNEIIKPVFEYFQKEVSAGLNDGDVPENEIKAAKTFVNYSLTEEDKVSIAKEVKFVFDWCKDEMSDPERDIELSDIVEGGIERWVKAKFNFWLAGW